MHIENGKRSLSTLELSEFTKLYHRSVTDFFAGGREQQAEPRGRTRCLIIHRLPVELINDPEVNRQVSRCVELCSIGVRPGDNPRHQRPDKPTRLRTSGTDPSLGGDSPG